MVGRPAEDIFEEHLPNLSLSERSRVVAIYRNDYVRHAKDKAIGIMDTIEFIANTRAEIKIAICSNASEEMIGSTLLRFGIADKVAQIIGRESAGKFKPHPQVYLMAMQKLSLKPSDCIAIEDSPNGARAAIDAGIPVYILRNNLNEAIDFSGLAIAGEFGSMHELLLLS
jgi:HAD superfamily hydrolase (TIGR01509 family)